MVIALRNNIEVYAWAPKPYHKFMAFKSFSDLPHKPMIVDLTVEEGSRLKVSIFFVSFATFYKVVVMANSLKGILAVLLEFFAFFVKVKKILKQSDPYLLVQRNCW